MLSFSSVCHHLEYKPLMVSPYPPVAPDVALSRVTSVKIVLIRHGERANKVPRDPWNLRRLPRPRDPPLTACGHTQARMAASSLVDDGYLQHPPSVIYCSPMTRCLHTAAPVAASLNVPVHVIYALAKPCKYFRVMRRSRSIPDIPKRDEMIRILSDAHQSARLSSYASDDGTSFRETVEKLAYDTFIAHQQLSSSQLSQPTLIIIGHSEAQVELARYSGMSIKVAPFCGRATFLLEWHCASNGSRNVDETFSLPKWTMTESPHAHRARQCSHRATSHHAA